MVLLFTLAAIAYPADFDNNATAETVHYYLRAAPAGSTHRVLYRAVSSINGGAPFELARDVGSLVFKFYDINGATRGPGLNISNMKSVNVKLLIESNAQVSEGIGTGSTLKYVKAYWERTIFPQNL